MTGVLKIDRLAPKPTPVRWFQPGKLARINCTGFTCETAETDLPFTPVFAPVNLTQGEYLMQAPSLAQAELLDPRKAYTLAVRLMNAGGQPVERFRVSVGVE